MVDAQYVLSLVKIVLIMMVLNVLHVLLGIICIHLLQILVLIHAQLDFGKIMLLEYVQLVILYAQNV
jgi:hypothetical protein